MESAGAESGRGRVQVFARVRPPGSAEGGFPHSVELNDETKTVRVRNSCDLIERVLEGQAADSAIASTEIKEFAFDGVFPTCSQQRDVFLGVGLPVLRECLKGFNGTILAYGQTGSGKTHSLLHRGPRSDDAGLLPRLVASLFVLVAQDPASVYGIEAAAIQVYNEQIDDLLHADHHLGGGQNLNVRDGGIVPGLSWIECKRPDQMLEIFTRARANVVYAETKMNKASSRSHAIFQLRISKRKRATEAPAQGGAPKHMECTQARLNVVDLAGSERVKKSGVEGAQFKEATNINKSLLAFGNVVSALAAKKQHVPLRDSKLTRILDGSIGGNCKTALLVCASPSAESVQETISTLEFASRAMRVEVDAKVNTCVLEVGAKALFADLSSDVEQLGGASSGPELEALRQQSVEAMEHARREAQRREREAAESEVQQQKLEEARADAERRGQKLQAEAESLRQSLQSSTGEASRLKAAVGEAEKSAAEWREEAARGARDLEEARRSARAEVRQLREAAEEEASRLRTAAEEAERSALVWKAQAEVSAREAASLGAARSAAEAEVARQGGELGALRQETMEASRQAEAAQARAEGAERAAEEARERVSRIQAELDGLREEAELQRAAAEGQRAAQRREASAALQASATEVEGLRGRVDEGLRQAEALSSELAARTEELRTRTAALDRAAAALEDLRTEADEREAGLRADFDAKLRASRDAQAAAVAHLEAQLAQARAEARATLAEEREAHATRSAALEEQLAHQAQQWAEQRAQLEVDRCAALDTQRGEYEARLRSGKEEFEVVLAQMERDHHAQRDDLTHQLEEKRADLERMEAQWRELKEQAVREAWQEGSMQQRRLAAAFKAARCISTLKESELRGRHEDLARRFASRESREEDVERIHQQRRALEAQHSSLQKNERTVQGLVLELSNRDATDRIFGSAGADKRHNQTCRPRSRPSSALAGKKLGEGTKNYAERRRALSQSASLELPATAQRLLGGAAAVPVC